MILSDAQINEFSEIISTIFHLIDEEKYHELEKYESDELLNRQLLSLNMLKKKNHKLHIDKVMCYPIQKCEPKKLGDIMLYHITVKVSFERYITDKDDNVIAGTKEYVIDTIYDVSFVENNPIFAKECRYCGAPLEAFQSKCNYCGSLTNVKSSKWIVYDLEEKEIVDPLQKTKEANQKYLEESWIKIYRDNSDNYHL